LPANCDSIEAWQNKQADETGNLSWLLENTKKCPQCKSPIEKNGGCMVYTHPLTRTYTRYTLTYSILYFIAHDL